MNKYCRLSIAISFLIGLTAYSAPTHNTGNHRAMPTSGSGTSSMRSSVSARSSFAIATNESISNKQMSNALKITSEDDLGDIDDSEPEEFAEDEFNIGDIIVTQKFNTPVYSISGIGSVTITIAATGTPGGTPSYSAANINLSIREKPNFDLSRMTVTL